VFAVAFDLKIKDVEKSHPKGVTQAYLDIRDVLQSYGFEWKQGSVYVVQDENLANLTIAMTALKKLPWFPASVRDIRAFRVEQWSDFTPFMKNQDL
jgi:virulence-associated protein VapD